MIVTYGPLFFATSTYTRLGLEQLQRETATKLATSVASRLAFARTRGPKETIADLARAEIEKESVHALSLLDARGNPGLVLGEYELLRGVFEQGGFGHKAEVRRLSTSLGPAILVYEPSPNGGVAAVVRVDPEITRANQLAKLMGLYMGVGALALLATLYFALTRWIVRPIVELEQGATRIAQGGERLIVPKGAPAEIVSLSARLGEMTLKLKHEQESLRTKIDELETRTRQLNEAQTSLVRSERLATVGRLSAGLAHEVGNPLSALMGLQDLMMDGALSEEEHRDFLERMKKETARIHRVLTDLLAYARPGGSRESEREPASGRVDEAVADVVALLGPQKDLKEVEIATEVEDNLPEVRLSQAELTQVLLNLTMNAANACEQKGKIVISVSQKDEETVVTTVSDDGPGVAPEVQETLFEPFVTTKEVGQGTGLGLSVSRGLVESVGGRIFVEANEPRGARFVFELPTVQVPSYEMP